MKIQSITSYMQNFCGIKNNNNVSSPYFGKSFNEQKIDTFEYLNSPADKPNQNAEYYFINAGGKEVKADGIITSKAGIFGEKLFITRNGNTTTYDDWARVKKDGGVTEEILYSAGIPEFIMEYKNEEPYKRTSFSFCPYLKSYVSYEDGSFSIYQNVDDDEASIGTIRKTKDKTIQTNFISTRKDGDIGACSVSIKDNSFGTKKVSLYWDYPEMNFSKTDSKEDSLLLREALNDLKATINSDEYRDDFGHTKSLNNQLDKAIKYLSK